MKKQIIFVDDDPLVLQGLQRMLRHMREQWEMEFVTSGFAALERMAQHPCDIIVTDMLMPGMNGAALLNEVMRMYPQTIRLILSGHADKELIMRCVGTTHQYLSKPCDAGILKATILRATGLDETLHNEALRRLVSQIDRVPSLPALYFEIVKELDSSEASMSQIAGIIAKDIGMTAKILKLVNSAFFGIARRLSDAQEAVSFLGVETIKSLVLSIQAFSQLDKASLPGFSPEVLWHHSLEVATMAKTIARAEHAELEVADESFTAGLLHDAGQLMLAGNFKARYTAMLQSARQQGLPLCEAETAEFGASHEDVGGYLLGLWGLPVPVAEAVALHHHPNRSRLRAFCPLTAVHAANALARRPTDPADRLLETPVDAGYLESLNLGGRFEVWRQLVQKKQESEAV